MLLSLVSLVHCIGVYIISFMGWDGCACMFQRELVGLLCKLLGGLDRRLRRYGFGFRQRPWHNDYSASRSYNDWWDVLSPVAYYD